MRPLYLLVVQIVWFGFEIVMRIHLLY